MSRTISQMTLKEVRALPRMDVNWDDDVRCDSVVLLPTGKKHDSGFGVIAFVPCVKQVPLGILGGCKDDVEWRMGAARPNTDRLHTDCMPKSRLMHVWGHCEMIIKHRLSSTDIEVVARRGQAVTTPATVAIHGPDLWPLLLSAIRYAMPRHSYIVLEGADWLERYACHLEPWQRGQIAREIREHVRIYAEHQDAPETWLRYADDLEAGRYGECEVRA